MMVPRAFASNPFATSPPKGYDEKREYSQERRRKSSSPLRPHASVSRSPSSSPSRLPKTNSTSVEVPNLSRHPRLQPSRSPTSVPSSTETSRLTVSQVPARPRESAQDVLASTAIPIRRKTKQRPSQRIPNGDYVADFSKLLLDDVRTTRDSSLSRSMSNPQFDGLFGNIDELVEDQMIIGSEGLDAGILSARSFSTESMPSLASPEDFSSADNASVSPSLIRSISDRRFKHLAASEECAGQHPLVDRNSDDEDDGDTTPGLSISPPQRRPMANSRKPSAFKSSLTASLKAIKAAAQSVSNIAAPAAVQPDDFGGHSFFDFHPALTDDRRPPPYEQPPSPALRRYLNPITSTPSDSPAQLHFWIDHRSAESPQSSQSDAETQRPKLKVKKKYLRAGDKDPSKPPPIIPLATCIPSQIRTAHASSPPVWLAPDGTPSNRQTASAMWQGTEAGLKQCEPRENRDFLRVYVCEMRMRKAKKLRDDIEGRAKMWLPPIEREARGPRPAAERLREYTAETLGDTEV